MIHRDPAELGETLKRRSSEIARRAGQAQRENANLIVEAAREMSGTRHYSEARLGDMGHPYARAHPHPPLPPYIVNSGTGSFNRGWKIVQRDTGDGIELAVVNDSPNARYMMGTNRMIPRPILEEAIRRTEGSRKDNIRRAARHSSGGR